MANFVDVAKFTASSGGTGTFTVSAAVTGYQTPASAGAVNGATYRYRAESSDLSQWEVGYGVYSSAGPTLTRATILFNSSGTTSAINFSAAPQVGMVLLAEDLIFSPITPQGRLTLQSATPVMTTTQSAKTTIYYTPYVGSLIPIYDGFSFRNVSFSEISVATTDTTKNPAAIGASKVNDWFIWDDAGTLRLTHSVDWTNDTTRASSLTMVNGILLNTSSITNGPAASRGTYVGTTRSNGSSQLDYIFGASASGGTASTLFVWNAYNRVFTPTTVTDSGASYTYTSATVRQARASAGMQISFVRGLDEDALQATANGYCVTTTTLNAFVSIGLGLDTTSAFSIQPFTDSNQAAAAVRASGLVTGNWYPGIGVHTVSFNEASDGTNANTFNFGSTNYLTAFIRN